MVAISRTIDYIILKQQPNCNENIFTKQKLDSILEINIGQSNALQQMIKIQLNCNNYQKALHYLQLKTIKDPKDGESMFQIAQIYKKIDTSKYKTKYCSCLQSATRKGFKTESSLIQECLILQQLDRESKYLKWEDLE